MSGLDSRTWTSEDQLRISFSPMLVAELEGNWLPYNCPVLEIFQEQVANGIHLEQRLPIP